MTRRNEPKEGTCRICGNFGLLSFEHVPPKAAFNKHPTIEIPIFESLKLGPFVAPKGPTQQGGVGGYTLCESCNNKTGKWYGKALVDWCYQGATLLAKTGGEPTLHYFYYLYPLRVVKQMVAMFLSVNSQKFRLKEEHLVRFVLDRNRKYLPPRYRFFAYYNLSNLSRFVGASLLSNVETGKLILMAEINFPPFGYVMTMQSEPPDDRLLEITHFARFGYEDHIQMTLKLPVLPVTSPRPGDYHSRGTII